MNAMKRAPGRQRGAALVVGLVLLVVLTILAVSGVFTSTMELRMVRNTQSQERAFQAVTRVFRRQPALDLWCEHDGTFSARTRPFSQTISAFARGILPQERQALIFVDEGSIEPGVIVSTLYGDFRVERVQYELEPNDGNGQLIARCWYS